ncbi:MAG TPA: low-specificity L-threonine aldolase [Bacteroidia bacterium]|nr:low-specificity L-threonine aldolase [Bacteroidia bacterium]
MSEIIDLRSDTVTKPTKEMLECMMNAEVGDDVFGEDPTVNELEKYGAELFGKESALFCPSGTMSNQIALRVHTQPGDEVICDIHSHIYHYETGGMAVHSGIQPKFIITDNGIINAQQVEQNINPYADWLTRTSLVVIENTCNRAGGTYYNLQNIKEIYEVTRKYSLKMHIDGARIFNAIVENDYTAKDVGKYCDTISVCLSKGLGSPVGTLLIGDKETIRKARRIRKQMGGGMRQGGILAAAGLYALKNHIKDLKQDHIKAKKLYEVLSQASYVKSIKPVYTNIVIFELSDNINPIEFEKKLAENGIRISTFGKQVIRMVTHREIDDKMMERVLDVLKRI